MIQHYVRHKNPNHEAIIKGDEWAIDSPFDSEVELEAHIKRCEYRERGIVFETYTEETNQTDSPNEPINPRTRRKTDSTV